jgi:hypothetical protein
MSLFTYNCDNNNTREANISCLKIIGMALKVLLQRPQNI